MRVLSVAHVVAALSLPTLPTLATAQEVRRISGRVTAEETHGPLIGVTVNAIGAPATTRTGEDGRFSLTVPRSVTEVRARRLGFKPRTARLPAGDAELFISLEADALQLDADVITGAATTVARRNSAVDIPVIAGEELNRTPAGTIENALAGKVAGVLVEENSGAPGGGLQMQIRGVTSVNGTSTPLYVIDGIIVSNDVIQNGVNAVTGGTFAQRPFPSNTDNAANRMADLNPADIEHIEILRGASATAIYGSKAAPGVVIITTKRGAQGLGRTKYSVQQRVGTYVLARKIGLRRFTLDEARAYDAATNPTPLSDDELRQNYERCGGYCDFEDELFGGGELSYETNVSASGGTPRTGFYVSAQSKYDNGLQRNTGFDRRNLRVNLTHQVSDRLSAQLNTAASRALTRRGATGNDNFDVSPYVNFATTPSFIYLKPVNGVYPRTPYGIGNPFQTADLFQAPVTDYRITTGGSLTYSALTTDRQTLSFRLDAGLDHTSERDELFAPTELFTEQAKTLPGTASNQSGDLHYSNANLSATHVFFPMPGSLSLTTSLGLQRERRARETAYAEAEGLLPGQSNVDRGSRVTVQELKSKTDDFAFFGQEELLALGERLLLTAGARGERSTNNGDVNRIFVYPKSSASFRIGGGMRGIDDLKLRVAYGQSGNQPLFGQKFTTLAPSVYDGRNALRPGVVYGAPGVKPERQTELEGGFDATLWGGRASINATSYRKRIDDLLLNRALGASTGFTSQLINGGQLSNTGIEVALGASVVQRSDVTVQSHVTFTRNRSKVTALPVPAFNIPSFGIVFGTWRIEEGKSATQILGNVCQSAGHCALEPLGDVMPSFQMGFANEIRFHGVQVHGFVDWRSGGKISSVTTAIFDGAGLAHDYEDGAKRLDEANNGGSAYVMNGGYVKLREITVSYDLPRRVIGGVLGEADLRLEASGRNLHTWTKYVGLDPEVSVIGNQNIARGIDLAGYPPSRSFFFTLGMSF